jgi:histidinol-phosphate aminotransferase
LNYIPSVGNFLTIQFEAKGPRSAEAAQEFLRAKGILPRAIAGYGLPEYLRFTIGLEDQNRSVVAALEEFLSAANGG